MLLTRRPKSFSQFPDEVLLQIFYYLDAASLVSCMETSRQFNILVDTKIWKTISLRDYSYFLYQIPLTDDQVTDSSFELRKEDEEEANKEIADPFKEPLSAEEQRRLEEGQAKIKDWKQFYLDCQKKDKYNLSGFWVGDYGDHGFELLRIYHKGYRVYAKKLTGDVNIPAKKLTWKMTLDKTMNKGRGEIHLADVDFKNSRWNTAFLDTSVPNAVKISWLTGVYAGYMCCITFSCVKIGKKEFDSRTMSRKVEVFSVPQPDQDQYMG